MSQLSTTIAKSKTNPQNLLTFHPPDKPNQYRAIGLVKGQFISEQGNPQRGILVTPDQVFPARLAPYLPNPPQTEVIWRVWVKTHFTEEGLSFYLKSCVRDEENHPISPQHLQQDYFSIRGQLQWWNLEEKQLGIRITPNSPQERSFKPFFLVIHGELSNPQKNSFWELSATREGKTLVLQEGQEIYPPKHKKKKAASATKVETVTTDELHAEIISAIESSIRCQRQSGRSWENQPSIVGSLKGNSKNGLPITAVMSPLKWNLRKRQGRKISIISSER